MTSVTAQLIAPYGVIRDSFQSFMGHAPILDDGEFLDELWSPELDIWLRTIASTLITQPSTVFFDGYPEFWIGAGATKAELDWLDRQIKTLQARRDRLATTLADTPANAV